VSIVNLGLLAWSLVPTDRERALSAALVIGVLAVFLPLVLLVRRLASAVAGQPLIPG